MIDAIDFIKSLIFIGIFGVDLDLSLILIRIFGNTLDLDFIFISILDQVDRKQINIYQFDKSVNLTDFKFQPGWNLIAPALVATPGAGAMYRRG